APVGRRERFACFDGLRALAATSVLAHHVASATGAVTSTAAGYVLAHLDVGVSVFFVLSGFLLYRPWALAHRDGTAGPGVAAFYRRRFLRIFPAYWVALTVFWVAGTIQLGGLRDAALFYGLVHIYSKAHVLGGIVPAWSLAVEVSFYAVLPLLAAVIGRVAAGSARRELGVLGALWAAGLATHGALLVTHDEATPATLWLPSQIDLFALGMILAVVHVRRWPAGLAAAAGRAPGLWWAARFDEETLRSIAQATGGEYYFVDSAGALKQTYSDLGRSVVWDYHRDEATGYAVMAATLCLLASLLLGEWRRRVI
ncbi:MAG: hypothetical protein C4333_12905, partial [Meiothermus sp.]